MKDMLTQIIRGLFTEDRKHHPMPAKKAATMMQRIKNLLTNREEK